MKTEVKKIGLEEYNLTVAWGKAKHSFPIMPQEIMPKIGFMSFVDDVPVFAAWMYLADDHLIGFIAYVIANPDTDNHQRMAGFEILMNEFELEAERNELKGLFTTTNTASLITRMKDSEFTVCDSDVVHLFKKPRYLCRI
jgi:hypothetical protein